MPGKIRQDIVTLPESGIVEVVNYGCNKEGLMPLWAGEGDVPTPGFFQRPPSDPLTPAWPNIFGAVQVAGAKTIAVQMSFGEDGWRVDFDALFAR